MKVWVRTDHYGDVALFATRELAEQHMGSPVHPRIPLYEADVEGTTTTVLDGYALQRARELHERHMDLQRGCPLCELEAAHQRDRLACEVCGEPIRPDEPLDGHPECEDQR